jgi:hypothetical protein
MGKMKPAVAPRSRPSNSSPYGDALVNRRCHRSSVSVHPGCFTLSQERVGPPTYGLASSLAT